MMKTFDRCGTGSVGVLDLREASVSNSEQMLPLAIVATKSQAFRDLERRNYAAFNALTGLASRLGCPPIFSPGLVKMGSEAISLSENRLQKGVEPFRAGHRFLQLLEKRTGIHIS
jgi:hypothetical protein